MKVVNMKTIMSNPHFLVFMICLAIVTAVTGNAFAQRQVQTGYKHSSDLSVITVGSGVPGP